MSNHISQKHWESVRLYQRSLLVSNIHSWLWLPLVIKLSKCLQTEKLDLSILSSLVHATLHTIDEALLPAANWVLELMDARKEIERATGVKVTLTNIASFQERVAKHFITDLKNNIVCWFTSQDVISSFSIFDPEKMPPLGTTDLSCNGEDCIDTILKHYGKDLTAKSVLAEESIKPALVFSDITSEWKAYRRYITQQPKEDMKAQLKELTTNSMLITMFLNLSVIANICLSIPVGTASVKWSFSQMKMIKTHVRNRPGELSLSLYEDSHWISPKNDW